MSIQNFRSIATESRNPAERTLLSAVGRECGNQIIYAEHRDCRPGDVPMDFVLMAHIAFTRYRRRHQ